MKKTEDDPPTPPPPDTEPAGQAELAALRRRGVGTVVIHHDGASYVAREDDESRAQLAAVRHALSEYDVQHHLIRAGDDLSQAIGTRVRIGA